jgi:hypothetical protein
MSGARLVSVGTTPRSEAVAAVLAGSTYVEG